MNECGDVASRSEVKMKMKIIFIMWRAVARRGVLLGGPTSTTTTVKPYACCASSSARFGVVARRGIVKTTAESSSLSNNGDAFMRRSAPRAVAQDWAEPEIRRFRRLDDEETRGAATTTTTKTSCVVFTGSSIFREWRERRDFDADWNGDGGSMAALKAVNRGFGGSMTVDVLRHAASVVNHEARDVKAVVYYAGSNDLSVGVSPETCAENFIAFVENCRERAAEKDGSKVGVVYVGVIDSPQKRAFGLSPAVRETNALCRKWCEETPNSAFVDVEGTFSNPDGSVKEEMFREDGTHLVAEAYVAFKAAIEPTLDEVLKGVALGESTPDDEDFLPPSMRSAA